MMFRTSQILKFTVALGFVLIASTHSIFAQGSAYSRPSAKTPPSPGQIFAQSKAQPSSVKPSTTSTMKPGTRGLWGSNGELKLLPPVDGVGSSPNSASSLANNKKLPPLPTDTIRKPVLRLAKSTIPSGRSSFTSPAPKNQSPAAQPIDWNQPSVIAGPLPSKWAVSQATAVKETKIADAPKPSAKIANVEAKIAPSYSAPTQQSSRYSVYREAKKPQSVASAINKLGTEKPATRSEYAPVSQSIPPMIKRPSSKPVFARISDDQIEAKPETQYSPIMACRLLGLEPVQSSDILELK